MQVRVRSLVAALAASVAFGLVPLASASPAGAAAKAVPAQDWAASFCTAFAPYVTNGFAAQQALQDASTATDVSGATPKTVATAMKTASTSATGAAKATTANGVPDVEHGVAIAKALGTLFRGSSRVFADAAKTATSFPKATKKLRKAANSLGGDISTRLDKLSAASKIDKLDAGHEVQQAVEGNATCAAATSSTSSTTTTTP